MPQSDHPPGAVRTGRLVSSKRRTRRKQAARESSLKMPRAPSRPRRPRWAYSRIRTNASPDSTPDASLSETARSSQAYSRN